MKSIHIPPAGGVPDRATQGSCKLRQLSEQKKLVSWGWGWGRCALLKADHPV